jgi:hypothetical protein
MQLVEEDETLRTEAVLQSCVMRARDGARGLGAATEVLVSNLMLKRYHSFPIVTNMLSKLARDVCTPALFCTK